MSEQTTVSVPQERAPVFRGSLVRTVVLLLMFIAVIPAAIIGGASYIRYRASLVTSLDSQLSSFGTNYALQIDQIAASNQTFISSIASSEILSENLTPLTNGFLDPDYDNARITIDAYLANQVRNASSSGLLEVNLVGANGYVLTSSNGQRIGVLYSKDDFVKSLYNTQKTVLSFNPGGMFPNKLVTVTTSILVPGNDIKPITIIAISNSPTLSAILQNPVSIYNAAHVFYVTSDHAVVSLSPVMGTAVSVKVSEAELTKLNGYISQSGYGKNFTYKSFTGVDVYSYIKPLNSIDSYYVIEVPQLLILNQLGTFQNFILLLIGATLLLSGLIAFIGARQVATPLVQLSGQARLFAGGDFSQKAKITRRDEIGLLAYSFNYMVEQLSTLYQNLESKVADRTKQLQIATEIGQDAVAATRTSDILHRVVQAVVEKFEVPYASVYLVDTARKLITLAEDHAKTEVGLPTRGLQLPLDNASLVGWVANNDQARVSQDIGAERPRLSALTHLPTSRSEIAVPIKIADRLIGVLNIQSDSVNGFDFETVPTYSTLANQIATGLRNIELLESTQVSMQESALLYKAGRDISQAHNDDEVKAGVTSLLTQTAYAGILLDIKNNSVVIVNVSDAQSTTSDKSLIGITIPFAEAIERLKVEGTIVINNFQMLSEFSQLTPYFGRRGCSSVALVPIYEGKDLLHLLALGSRDENSLTLPQVQQYSSLAESIGVTLERAHLIEKLDLKEKEFTTFEEITAISLTNANVLDLCTSLHDKLKALYGDEIGLCVALNDENKKQVNLPYFNDQELVTVDPYDYTNDLVSELVQHPEMQHFPDAYAAGRYAVDSPLIQRPVKSWAGYPMTIGGKVIGAIAMFDPNQADIFDDEFKKISSLIASQITLAISDQLVQSELLNTQTKFEREQFMLDSLLENIPDRIFFKGNNNDFLRVSKSLASFLGVTDKKDLVGKVDDYHYVLEDEQSNANVDGEVISTLTPIVDKNETWTNRFGASESLVTNKIPLRTKEGDVLGLLNISRNVTEQLKVEQLAKHRADQLQTASEIAKESTAGSMDVQVTLARLVELIRSRFGFYHASIFLIDPLGKNAILRESTGEAGAQMKSAGHKLAVGSPSIVGQATSKGTPVVIADVTAEDNYFANPLLPDTRSELAIPLKIGERVLGALDVQSRTTDAFSQEDINILQVLADQIAVAIQNADLYTHTSQNLSRYRLLHQITSVNVQTLAVDDSIHNTIEILHQAMPEERVTYFSITENNFLTAQASAGYPTPDLTTRRIQVGQGVIGTVARDRVPARVDDAQLDRSYRPLGYDTNSILAIPVTFANQLLGVINIESTTLAKFDDSDQEFVTTLADNTASIISNIRLIDQVREQVDRQQKLFEITNKIRRSVDIETIMQTSITEICSAMNIPRATIHISAVSTDETNKEKAS
jgi:GAF domain-containing protein/HAMP domain-containing protein